MEDLVKLCEGLSVDSHINTADEFIDALRKIVKPPVPPMTFGDFTESLITEMKTGANNKRPSRTFQLYVNLLHKLQKEGCIINLLVRDVNNSHFIQFSDFILSLTDKEGRSNYMNLMKLFKQVHKKAYNRELTDNILRFKYSDYAPMKDDAEKSPALTLKQYEKFVNMDPNKVGVFGPNVAFYNEMYHDFCIFLYETKSRPVDTLKAHSDDVVKVNGKWLLRYIAEKKKNYTSKNKIIYSPLSSKAVEIIEKYKGQSSQGFIFPFSINQHHYDTKDAKDWEKWNNRKNRALGMINAWLKKAAAILKIDFPLTLYTFRHSALTHACMQKGANYLKVALDAGTSPDMLLKHYVSNTLM